MEQKNTKSQQSILDWMGKRGVHHIIPNPIPFPRKIYISNPDNFVTEVLEESKGPRLVKSRNESRTL